MHTRTVHHFSAIMDWNSTILNHSSSDAGNAAHAQDEHDADADAPIKYNLVVAIILGIILSVLDLTTILGNLLVCVTILSRRSLRNTTNYFILSLSSSDLLLGIIVLPFSTINTLLKVRTKLIHKKNIHHRSFTITSYIFEAFHIMAIALCSLLHFLEFLGPLLCTIYTFLKVEFRLYAVTDPNCFQILSFSCIFRQSF